VNFSYIALGLFAFAALLFYAWLEDLWSWTRPLKGALDLDVESERPPPPTTSTDIKFIEGNRK
jgi:hypothetical protein